MRSLKGLATFLLVASFTACSSMTIETDFNPQATGDMAEYRTYALLPHPTGGDPRVHNPLVASRVETAVDETLAAKGYTRASAASADFMVGWHAALEGKVDVQTVDRYYGYGYGGWYGRYGRGAVVSNTHVREYDEGTLIIDVVDKSSNELVWRGSVQAEVYRDVSPQERQARITKAIQAIFEDFPPS